MQKMIVYCGICCMCVLMLCGCSNTWKGVQEDTKSNWGSLKAADEKFQKEWW